MTNIKELENKIMEMTGKERFAIPCTHRIMADESGCPSAEHFREVRLSDVLLAIDKKDTSFSISCFGLFEKWEKKDPQGENDVFRLLNDGHQIRWNLLKDDLTLQSPETISFLYQLLK